MMTLKIVAVPVEVAFLLLLSSGVCLLIGTYLLRRGNHFLKNGKRAEAVIFSNYYDGDAYYPVIRFLTDKQEWITHQLDIGHLPKKREGKKLQVVYDPEDPTDVQRYSFFMLAILPRLFIALGLIGVMFVALAVLGVINPWP
jgi:hypothetical protein